jgi:hypothetical protein
VTAAPHAQDILKVGIAQIAPVWLDRAATLEKVASYVSDAADAGGAVIRPLPDHDDPYPSTQVEQAPSEWRSTERPRSSGVGGPAERRTAGVGVPAGSRDASLRAVLSAAVRYLTQGTVGSSFPAVS